jgi:hypothetical protein
MHHTLRLPAHRSSPLCSSCRSLLVLGKAGEMLQLVRVVSNPSDAALTRAEADVPAIAAGRRRSSPRRDKTSTLQRR